jgi:hypothetical protein
VAREERVSVHHRLAPDVETAFVSAAFATAGLAMLVVLDGRGGRDRDRAEEDAGAYQG